MPTVRRRWTDPENRPVWTLPKEAARKLVRSVAAVHRPRYGLDPADLRRPRTEAEHHMLAGLPADRAAVCLRRTAVPGGRSYQRK